MPNAFRHLLHLSGERYLADMATASILSLMLAVYRSLLSIRQPIGALFFWPKCFTFLFKVEDYQCVSVQKCETSVSHYTIFFQTETGRSFLPRNVSCCMPNYLKNKALNVIHKYHIRA